MKTPDSNKGAEPDGCCPKCGTPIPGESRTGSCVHCLLGFALELEELDETKTFGAYQLEEMIGRGGMGIVYRARQPSVDRVVALKMIVSGELATPEALRRFRVETEAAANLHHPNIVPIHDVGEVDGLPYYTMRFVEGGDLSAMMPEFVPATDREEKEPRAKQDRIATFVATVARAVGHAHEHGVLHRDLKPTNLLIDETGEPQLTDFGLAKRMQDEQAAITLSSSALGSPSYMAPEQSSGESTTASDVWSLGAILYEMLVGEPPFTGKTAMETLRRVIDETPVAPRRKDPALSRDLETICLKCLEKNPTDRYATAAALADDLDRFLRREPVLARPVSGAALFLRWCRRNPVPAGLAASLLVALIVGVAGVTSQWIRADRANIELTDSVRHLEWRRIRSLEEQDQTGQALATLAARLRENPNDYLSASYALSLLRDRRFPIPLGRRFSAPGEKRMRDVSFDDSGRWIAGHAGENDAWIFDGHDGSLRHTLALSAPVTSLAMAADGSVLAVGTEDGAVRFFDPDSGEETRESWACGGRPRDLVFLPGENLATAAGNRIVEKSIAPGGGPEQTLFESTEPIRFLRRDGSGRRLLATTEAETILLDSADGSVIASVELDGPPRETFLSADGSVFGVRVGPAVSLFDETGAALGESFGGADFNASLLSAALSPDGTIFAGGHVAGEIRRSTLPTGSRMSGTMTEQYGIGALAFGNRGRELLSGSFNGNARLWDLGKAAPASEVMRHPDEVAEVWFLEETDGASRILTAELAIDGDWSYHLWTVPRAIDREVFADNGEDTFDSTAISPDGRWIAVGARGRKTQIFDRTGTEVLTLSEPAHPAGLHFSNDSETLFLLAGDGSLSVVAIPGGEWIATHESIGFPVLATELDRAGAVLAVGSRKGPVGAWDVSDPAAPEVLWTRQGEGFASQVVPSPSGDRLLVVRATGEADVHDLRSGELVSLVRAHEKKIIDAAFSPDGTRFVTGSFDLTARVWDTGTGTAVSPPLPHRSQVAAVAFSDDGTLLATGSRDGIIKLWDPDTFELVGSPMRENSSIRWLGFTGGGALLGSFSHLGARVWDVATSEPATTLRHQADVTGLGVQGSCFHSFLPGPDLLVVGVNTSEVALWDLSPSPGPAPAWLPSVLEAVASQRLGPEGVEALPFDEAARILEKFAGRSDPETIPVRRALGLVSVVESGGTE